MGQPEHTHEPHGDDTEHGAALHVLRGKLDTYGPHPETSHTEHTLTYLVGGWFRMEHGGAIEAGPGTFTVIPAGVPHRPLAGESLDYWMLDFCPSCLVLDEGQPLMSPFRRVRRGAFPVLTVPEARRPWILSLFRELRDEQARSALETPELRRSLALLLLGEVRRSMPGDDAHGSKGSLVADALEMIQRRCLEPISLDDVAAAVHRTPAHVAGVVKKETGYTVGAWIRAGRVAEAALRLAHTDDPLQDIAEHVGWRDKTHFIRQFRKLKGVTPAAWRRSQRARHR